MTRTLVLATQNADKVRELARLFADLPVRLISAAEWGSVPEVVEDGDTLEFNARKKAREIALVCGELCLADDTGLEVDALDGAPGVYAARYAGPAATYADNCAKLLASLASVPAGSRTARFRTVMAAFDPASGWSSAVDGVLEGEILVSARGDGGFGYDPVFLVPSAGLTLAEMDLAAKNQISHRALASRAMLDVLREYLGG